MILPKGGAGLTDCNISVQAFVQFAEVADCEKAKAAIHGRLFAGITVQANYVSQEVFTSAVSS